MKSSFKTFVGALSKANLYCSLIVAAILFSAALSSAALGAEGLSILQGATDASSAQFSVVVPKGSDFEIVVNGKTPQWRDQIEDPNSDWAVLKFKFDGLQLGRSYDLSIWNEQGQLLDEREFSALDSELQHPKVALASCMVDWLHNPGIWRQMQSLAPDLVVFLGDTTYVDIGSPERLISRPDISDLNHWERFVETRHTLDIYKWKKLTPILAIMDDHDYGMNNADSSFHLKDRANYVFETFFAQRGANTIFEMGPGQSFKADLFGLSFLFLDGRTFRTEDRILGDEQLVWMKSLDFKGRTLMLSGSQFFGAYLKKDSFEGLFAEAFKEFTKFLKEFSTQFVFASGDIHFSEVMKIEEETLGYPTYEITSSSVHSFTMAGGHVFRPSNPRRIPGMVTSTHNFITLDIGTPSFGRNENFWVVRSHGWRGQNLFETQLEFSDFNPIGVNPTGTTPAFSEVDCSNFLKPQNSRHVPKL